MVLGEHEILGQVKAAFELSRAAETTGTVFHRLASRAFNVGKRARSETGIGVGGVSVAYAAIELAEKVFRSLEGRGALLVGTGENGKLCAAHLLARGVAPLIVANRTPAKAEALAARLGGEIVPLERIGDVLDQVDIVVTTTGASAPIIGPALVSPAAGRRGGRSLVFVDVAVPRDVDPAVDRLPNVFRFDLDAVQGIVEHNLERRRQDQPAVEAMVEAEVLRFMGWWDRIGSGPVLSDLHRRFEAVRAAEVARNAGRFGAADAEQLETFTRSLLRKLLMDVTLEIKHYRVDDPVQAERLAALRELFRLDAAEPQEDQEDQEETTTS
jgi:glutamyl-tRNA reductase